MPAEKGLIKVETLKENLRKVKDSQAPKTTVFEIENANSLGRVYPLDDFYELTSIAKKEGLHVHMDGGRMFYACDYYKIEAKELLKNVDSVMFCLSKGLSAPSGSIVAGTKDFISKFRYFRKMLGGNMRKPGILAGPALLSLTKMREVVS